MIDVYVEQLFLGDFVVVWDFHGLHVLEDLALFQDPIVVVYLLLLLQSLLSADSVDELKHQHSLVFVGGVNLSFVWVSFVEVFDEGIDVLEVEHILVLEIEQILGVFN